MRSSSTEYPNQLFSSVESTVSINHPPPFLSIGRRSVSKSVGRSRDFPQIGGYFWGRVDFQLSDLRFKRCPFFQHCYGRSFSRGSIGWNRVWIPRQSFSCESIDVPDNGRETTTTTTTTSLVISFIRGHFSKDERGIERGEERREESKIVPFSSHFRYIYIYKSHGRLHAFCVGELSPTRSWSDSRLVPLSLPFFYPSMQSYRSFSIFSAIRIIHKTISEVCFVKEKKKTLVATREDEILRSCGYTQT